MTNRLCAKYRPRIHREQPRQPTIQAFDRGNPLMGRTVRADLGLRDIDPLAVCNYGPAARQTGSLGSAQMPPSHTSTPMHGSASWLSHVSPGFFFETHVPDEQTA